MAPAAPVKPIQMMADLKPAEASLSAAPTRFLPDTLDDVRRISCIFYDSGMMASHFYDSKRISDPAVRRASGVAGIGAMIMYGAELGLSPMQAMRMMHVIEGRAVLSAAGKVALVKRSPRCVYFRVIEESNTHCIAETARRGDDGKAGPPRRLTVRIGQAPANSPADTIYIQPGSGPAWSKYPARMVKARCTSWLCDDEYEDVTAGLYSAEEIIDLRDNRTHDQRLEAIFDMVDASPQTVAAAGTDPENVPEPLPATSSQPGQTIDGAAPIESSEARLRAELAAATTPAQCVDLHRRGEEIEDAEARKKFRTDVLIRREQLGAQQ